MAVEPVAGIRDSIDERGIARLEIDRPGQRNALDTATSDRIIEICRAWRDDSSVRLVVLTGRGGSFCAGADVAGMARSAAETDGFDEQASRAIIESGSNLVGAIRDLAVPVVAAVDGPAVGIGASLAVAADLVYATERSYFLLAFVNIGLMPDGGASALFTASLGRARANELALLGERLSATEAAEAGLINAVVDGPEALTATVERVAGRVLAASPAALAATKSALDGHALAGFSAAIEREISGQTRLLQEPAFQQAIAAFAAAHR